MDALDYIFIGILQGILEWLPVSSKGIEALIMVKFFDKTLSDLQRESILAISVPVLVS